MRSQLVLVIFGVSVGCNHSDPRPPADASFDPVCVDGEYALAVAPDVALSFDRSYAWAIDFVPSHTSLVLSEGQVFDVTYRAQLSRTWRDQWRATGTVTIANPAPFAATVTGIVVRFAETEVAFACGVTFPYEIAAGGVLRCSGDVAIAEPPQRFVVEVSTTGCVGPVSHAVALDLASATMRETDECIEVAFAGASNEASACGVVASPQDTISATCQETTLELARSFGPYCCGDDGALTSTLRFVTGDTATSGSATAVVSWGVPTCWIGCTLTEGYWKTHTQYGPSRFDDAWLAIGPAGADTPFYATGKTYFEELWISPQGNPYDILAHAYIAAKLNALNETAWGVVADAFKRAETMLVTGGEREEMLELAALFDAYNTGAIGPGHCTE